MIKALNIITSRLFLFLTILIALLVTLVQTLNVSKRAKMLKRHPLHFITQYGVEYLDSRIVQEIYQIMKDTTEILDKEGIKYWADGSTLIGAIRHRGFIPWNDHLDIAIAVEDAEKVRGLEKLFLSLGYNILKNQDPSSPIKIYPQTGIPTDPKTEERYPFITIFPMKLIDGDYVHASKEARSAWANDKFKQEDIENLEPCQFGALTITCPKNPAVNLKSFYGYDVLYHGIYNSPYYINNKAPTKKWTLRPWEYASAPHSKLSDRVKK